MGVRLLLFADLHLDAPFAWAGARAARAWRGRLREVLVAIADSARALRVDAVLCAGDLYEHERISPDTGEFVRQVFQDLDPIRVFVTPGNHDWYGPESPWARLDWSANVHVFREDRLEPVALADDLTLWGAAHRAPANTDDFLSDFAVDRGGVHLALFHGSERGGLAAQGGGKVPHAPFVAADLERAGLQHAFLGHYHRPRDGERITYPGNPDPLSFGEDGARGAVLASVGPNGRVERERHVVARTVLHDLGVDVSECASSHEVRERVAAALSGHTGLARVTLHGSLEPRVDLRPGELMEPPPGIEALQVRADPGLRVAYDLDAIAAEPTVRGEFVRGVREDPDLEDDVRHAVLVAGLRAFEGRSDLEAL